jgi:predicted aldo/keto reductase-like oxidoreductase
MSTNEIGRRDFMKSSLAGVGSFFFLPEKEPGSGVRAEAEKPGEKKVLYRTLGKTGIKVPPINMGVMNSDNPNLVRAALSGGMVMLDTAQTYQRGTNETMIGEVLKGRQRDSFILATKSRLPNDQKTGLYLPESTEEAYTKKIDTSLKNLGLDYVDIYYHHNVWAKESALYEPILNALRKAKKAGKTRFIGITTHRSEPEVIYAAVESKVYDVVLTTYNFKQKHYPEIRSAMAKAAEAGLGVVVMKALGGKQLQEGSKEPIDPKAALKWALQDPNTHTIIAGFTTFDQMNLDLAVMEDPVLTKPEKAHLRRGALTAGLFCQGCGRCLNRCAQALPIPDLMRAYMYVYGYRNLVEAQDLLASLRLPSKICEDCDSCAVSCAVGFRVRERIRNVVRLRDVPAEFIA